MLTLNQIHAQIVTLANAHFQIAEVGMGTIAELQGKPDRLYPLLWLSNEGGSLEDNYKVDNIRLTMFGRVIAGEEGQDDDASEIEVLSDMQLILLDFLNYFHQQHGQEYVTDKAATLEHFTERTNDRTAGYSVVLELKQFYDWNKCQIPQSGASIPPTVDGLTLYDFCDQSVLDRLTATQVSCLEDEFGGVCVDATVHNSDNSYSTTVASGGDLPLSDNVITLKDTAANVLSTTNVPATNAADIEAADSTNEVNGVDISDPTLAGGTHNQQIHDSAGADIGTAANPSVVSDSTIQNNATPTWSDTVEAEGTLTLAQAKALDSDGATTLLADYIPASDGFMFTCTPGSSASLSVGAYSDADHATPISTTPINTTVYIRATPSDFTPDSYLFFSYDGTDLIKIGEQAGGDISWFPTLALTSGYVYAVASDSVSGVKAWSRVDFDVVGDTDAEAFISAALITDDTQKIAITTLVLQLKSDSIWSKFHAIYPLVGGSAFSHKFNLINPLDTDAAFRLVFSGGVTHSLDGIHGNGANGWADTFYQPSVSATQNSASLSFYSRTNNTSSVVDMGAGSTSNRFDNYVYSTGWYANINQSTAPFSAAGGSLGMFEASRVSSTQIRKRKNGAFIVAETVTSNAPTSNILGLMSFGASLYSNRNYAFFSVGTHLDDTESANFYNAVQAFQTSLGRNV